YEAFKIRQQRNEMQIRSRQGFTQPAGRLEGLEDHVWQIAPQDLRSDEFELMAGAYDQESDVLDIAKPFGCSQDGRKVVRAAEIAGIADDEPLRQIPFRAQRVLGWVE